MKWRGLSMGGAIILMAPAALIYVFSTSPSYTYSPADKALLIVSFKKSTEHMTLCDEEELREFKKEASKRRKHMQRAGRVCGSRERVPLLINVWIDGKKALDKTFQPSGLRNDGVTYVFERFHLGQGEHRVKVAMRDYRDGSGDFSHSLERDMLFAGRQVVLIDFNKESGRLFVH